MLSVGSCGVVRLQMKVGHMDGMHCFIESTSIFVKIKSVSLYKCRTVYFICLILYILGTMYTDFLASINCAVTSPNFGAQILENHLLPSKSNVLKSMKSNFPLISSPLQRFHYEAFDVIIAHSLTVFRERNSM